jgi:hypothetical protein
MFVLGNLQIRILKMLARKPLSTIWLYSVLAKEGVKKLAFENAAKSLEKKRLVCIESLSLGLTDSGRKMLVILETTGSRGERERKNHSDSPTKEKFIGNVSTSYHGKLLEYGIYLDGKSYKIISSQSKKQANYATVSRDTVEKVYDYLKKGRRKRSASDIEEALGISSTTIHNALKVLRAQKRADFEIFGTKRQNSYKAL